MSKPKTFAELIKKTKISIEKKSDNQKVIQKDKPKKEPKNDIKIEKPYTIDFLGLRNLSTIAQALEIQNYSRKNKRALLRSIGKKLIELAQ